MIPPSQKSVASTTAAEAGTPAAADSPRHALEIHLAQSWAPEDWASLTVLVGVSGGPDSVALLRGLARLRPEAARGRLVAAHFNHHLRPEADDEARFVAQLADQLQLPCELGSSRQTGLALDCQLGLEEAARLARYRFFTETADRLGARYLALAHTADDQAETILHHILRGTGLAGLAGMRRARPLSGLTSLVRPLLNCRRATVIDYLASLGQAACNDPSNRDTSLTRNRLRHELLPQLARDYNPQVIESLLRLGSLAGEAHEAIRCQLPHLATKTLSACNGDQLQIDCCTLAAEPPYVVREFLIWCWQQRGWPLQAMTYSHWQQLAAMVAGPPGGTPCAGAKRALTLPGAIQATRQGDLLRLARGAGNSASCVLSDG